MAQVGRPGQKTYSGLDERGLTVADLSRLVGRSTNHVAQLVKDGVLRKIDQGRFAPEAVQDFIRHVVEGIRYKLSVDGDAKRRIAEGKAELIQLELQERRQTLMPTHGAINAMTNVVQQSKQKLLAISTRLAPRIVTAKNADEAKKMIDAEIHLALTELSETPRLRPQVIDGIVEKAVERM